MSVILLMLLNTEVIIETKISENRMHLLNAGRYWEVKNDSKNRRERAFLLVIKIFGSLKIIEWINSWQCLYTNDT